MIKNFSNWLDHRTGYRKFLELMLLEHIPGGAKWRYVWGSALAFVFSIQVVTGILLMTAYSPGESTAWASVYYIQYEMDFGWLIRGLHHFGSGTMVVLLGLHMIQVVIAGAHLPPRELNWWLGLALLALILGMSLTGYLLPWDQKGYYATQVATNIAGNIPVVGPIQQKIIVGGPSYGHHTLTRFFALHVAILPSLIVLCLVLHIAVFRRHGVTAPGRTGSAHDEKEHAPKDGDGLFWPDQAFRDMLVGLAIFALLLIVAFWGHGHPTTEPSEQSTWERIAHAGQAGRGANLDAPADPAEPYPARPEWYFLFLFQLLKYFEGHQEIVGTVVIPAGAGLLLFVLPLLGYGRMRAFGHWFGIAAVIGLLAGAGILTFLAISEDNDNPEFQKQLAEAGTRAARAVKLAGAGIPAEGAIRLLQRDPLTKGRELFGQYCASCHSYRGEFEQGEFKASDLAGFGTAAYIHRLITNPGHPDFFGRTDLKKMAEWVEETFPDISASPGQEKELSEDDPEALKGDKEAFRKIAGFLAKHPRPNDADREATEYKEGLELMDSYECLSCHDVAGRRSRGDFPAPDLTGYGDARWIRQMILIPYHPGRYGSRNRMPAFRDLEGPAGAATQAELVRLKALLNRHAEDDDARSELDHAIQLLHLSEIDRELIIRYILQDHRIVFGGEPAS